MNKICSYLPRVHIVFPTSLFIVFMYVNMTLAAGGVTGGGGQCVVMSDGSYRFLDMLDPDNFEKPGLDGKSLHPVDSKFSDRLWEKDRYVTKIYHDNEFDSCVRLKKESRILEQLPFCMAEPYLSNQPATANTIELLHTTGTSVLYSPIPLLADFKFPQSEDFISPTIDAKYQIPCAFYKDGIINISKRIFEKLPPQDRAALYIHEAMRYLNYWNFLQSPLTTKEIEVATRIFMNLPPRKGDNFNAVLNKLKAVRNNCNVQNLKNLNSFEEIHNYIRDTLKLDGRRELLDSMIKARRVQWIGLNFDKYPKVHKCVKFDTLTSRFINSCVNENILSTAHAELCDVSNQLKGGPHADEVNKICSYARESNMDQVDQVIAIAEHIKKYVDKNCYPKGANKCNSKIIQANNLGRKILERKSDLEYDCVRFSNERKFIRDCQ